MIYDTDTLLSLTDPSIRCPAVSADSPTERDMRVTLALFRQFLPLRVLEFGIGAGTMASFLLDNCPFIADYVGVDLLPKEPPYRNRRLFTILTDGTVKDFHEKLCLHVGDVHRYFDAIILDANYGHESSKRDTEACRPFLRGGGLCFWRGDGKHPGITKYLSALVCGRRKIMVPDDRAPECQTNEWCTMAWEIM